MPGILEALENVCVERGMDWKGYNEPAEKIDSCMLKCIQNSHIEGSLKRFA